jgi:two-component system sensor histidine kinase SenX3
LGFLLASISELAGLRTGTPIARTETLETASVLHEAARVLGWRHPAHDASISITIDPSSEKCMGDRQKLVMAVGELLDNAVKFSPVGSKVFVSATSRGNELVISVADEGPGFPDAAKKNIGLPFWQADMTAARQAGGAGLGLALVVGLVAAHGGHVDVESVDGKGARVNIHLPDGSKTVEEPPPAQGAE